MKKKENLDVFPPHYRHDPTNIALVISLIALVITIVTCIFLFIHYNKVHYEKCLNNPPTIAWVEEDLGDTFFTDDVVVYKETHEEETKIIYIVEANGLYYKVLYEIKRYNISYWWGMVKYVQVAESEVNK